MKNGILIACFEVFGTASVLSAVRNLCQTDPVEALKAVKSMVKVATVFPIIPSPGLINTEKACESAIPPDNLRPLESPSRREPSVIGYEKILAMILP